GRQWFRADRLLPESGVVLEADGAVKYRDRPDADAIVTMEKERERLLRAAGFGVVRYTRADALNRPKIIVQRAQLEARLRPSGPAPTCWAPDPPWGHGSDILSDHQERAARLNFTALGIV
ncbi:MAG TPA: hypothetical protein VIJ00_12125, partial [Nakamurella sp.]